MEQGKWFAASVCGHAALQRVCSVSWLEPLLTSLLPSFSVLLWRSRELRVVHTPR